MEGLLEFLSMKKGGVNIKFNESELELLTSEYFRDIFLDLENLYCLCYEKPSHISRTKPDLICVNGPEKDDYITCIVEAEPTYERAVKNKNHGINQLKEYRGNVKWLVIPKSEYNPSMDVFLKDTGIDLLLIDIDGAEERTFGNFHEGFHLDEYPMVKRFWENLVTSDYTFYWVKRDRIFQRKK